MTLEGLGEVFKGDSADMCAGKFPLVSMGGRADRQACADGERGPPSARAELSTENQLRPGWRNEEVQRADNIYTVCTDMLSTLWKKKEERKQQETPKHQPDFHNSY